MSGRYAILIANTEYTDSGLAQLTAPGKDAEDFARVLNDQNICAFDEVKVLLNQPESIIREAIDEFFHEKQMDDLLVLYFSGHGVRDELGALYLAVKNTNRFRLRSTAVKSDFIREAMDQSRSKRQVLILDCCNSGAFAQGMKAATGVSIGTATAFEAGYGRIILTASDSTQYAWEGDKIIGKTDNSLFTHFLVEGLEGEADLDGDGHITVDELYDYAYEQVKFVTPNQTPSKFSSKQQGEIVLRQHMRMEDIKPLSLPAELLEETEDTRPYVREAAVLKLEKILKGKNIALAHAAREGLEKIAADDNSTRRVSFMATQALEFIHRAEKEEPERKAKEEADALLQAEGERVAREKAEEERRLASLKATEERLAREKAEAAGAAEQPAEEERKVLEKAKHPFTMKVMESPVVPVVNEGSVKPQPIISQRVLYSGIAAILLIGLALLGRSVLRNVGPGTTPDSPVTTNRPVDVGAPINTILLATNTARIASPSATVDRTPSSVPASVIETNASIAVSRAYIYKGPALDFGLVVQKSYERGETFTVLARTPSGLWLLGETSDGNQGWLYIEWVDLDVDSRIVPTASFIPALPPTATRRPGGDSAPTACENFC